MQLYRHVARMHHPKISFCTGPEPVPRRAAAALPHHSPTGPGYWDRAPLVSSAGRAAGRAAAPREKQIPRHADVSKPEKKRKTWLTARPQASGGSPRRCSRCFLGLRPPGAASASSCSRHRASTSGGADLWGGHRHGCFHAAACMRVCNRRQACPAPVPPRPCKFNKDSCRSNATPSVCFVRKLDTRHNTTEPRLGSNSLCRREGGGGGRRLLGRRQFCLHALQLLSYSRHLMLRLARPAGQHESPAGELTARACQDGRPAACPCPGNIASTTAPPPHL